MISLNIFVSRVAQAGLEITVLQPGLPNASVTGINCHTQLHQFFCGFIWFPFQFENLNWKTMLFKTDMCFSFCSALWTWTLRYLLLKNVLGCWVFTFLLHEPKIYMLLLPSPKMIKRNGSGFLFICIDHGRALTVISKLLQNSLQIGYAFRIQLHLHQHFLFQLHSTLQQEHLLYNVQGPPQLCFEPRPQ